MIAAVVSEMFSGLFEAFFRVILFAVLAVGLAIGLTWYLCKSDKIESKTRIVPEMKLVTDGKTVDTVFIYKKPNG